MNKVVKAFVEIANIPGDHPVPCVPSAKENTPEFFEQLHAQEKAAGACASRWLKQHAVEWLRLAGAEAAAAALLENREFEAAAQMIARTRDPVDRKKGTAGSEGKVVNYWSELAPVRAGFEAAARTAGEPGVDRLCDLARDGFREACRRAHTINFEEYGLFVDSLLGVGNACAYEMFTGEPLSHPEPDPLPDPELPNAEDVLFDDDSDDSDEEEK